MVSFKQRAQDFVGYDPQVTAAASTTASLKSATQDLPAKSLDYIRNLFPFLRWIAHYNLTWAVSDLIAGLTVGMVVGESIPVKFGGQEAHFHIFVSPVPQSMSYAKIAGLPAQYGLYSSFVGGESPIQPPSTRFDATRTLLIVSPFAVMVYAFVRPGGAPKCLQELTVFIVQFATSKDVTIGPGSLNLVPSGRAAADALSHPQSPSCRSRSARSSPTFKLSQEEPSTLPPSSQPPSPSSLDSSSSPLDSSASDGSSSSSLRQQSVDS